MDGEKLFDEKLKKRINEENVIVPPELNEKINRTLHNLPVKKKGYRVYMMVISAAVLTLSIVSMSEFSDQIFAQNGGKRVCSSLSHRLEQTLSLDVTLRKYPSGSTTLNPLISHG